MCVCRLVLVWSMQVPLNAERGMWGPLWRALPSLWTTCVCSAAFLFCIDSSEGISRACSCPPSLSWPSSSCPDLTFNFFCGVLTDFISGIRFWRIFRPEKCEQHEMRKSDKHFFPGYDDWNRERSLSERSILWGCFSCTRSYWRERFMSVFCGGGISCIWPFCCQARMQVFCLWPVELNMLDHTSSGDRLGNREGVCVSQD